MKKILILSDGKAGHYNQSLAVAEAIKQIETVKVILVEVSVQKRTKYFLRLLLNSRIGQKWLKENITNKKIAWFYKGYDYEERPDIIISSGKDTSMLNSLLGLMYNAKTFFIGNPKKLHHSLFTAILTVLDLGFDNQILLDVAPILPFKGDVKIFCKEHGLSFDARYCTLLIGGDGSGYCYSEEEYESLIDFVNNTSSEIHWLVTTSRRTPIKMEEKMHQQMKAAMFVAYNKKPQKVIGAFLALSDLVFVTEESASMLSEAVVSQKFVISLIPKNVNIDTNYQKILFKFQNLKYIQRLRIDQLKNFKYQKNNFSQNENSFFSKLVNQLKKVIKENG